jgi:hypothetical protein
MALNDHEGHGEQHRLLLQVDPTEVRHDLGTLVKKDGVEKRLGQTILLLKNAVHAFPNIHVLSLTAAAPNRVVVPRRLK